ncbi:hypothetical protein SLS58_007399 [Diplodia intermedia]|uniref:Uncharacterized protein n=1 Tax=Diplodia intermedia TaxID=856260 RepID=A0ABR3TKS3_9PEZI
MTFHGVVYNDSARVRAGFEEQFDGSTKNNRQSQKRVFDRGTMLQQKPKKFEVLLEDGILKQ